MREGLRTLAASGWTGRWRPWRRRGSSDDDGDDYGHDDDDAADGSTTGTARRPTVPVLTDKDIQERCGFVELFSPWLLSSVAHIRYERGNERLGRNLIELARRFDGQVRMGTTPLTLWMSVLRSKAERDRNRRLLRMAEETQGHLHVDAPDALQAPWKLVCWRSATVVVARRRIASVRQEDMSTVFHDGCWDSQVFACDPETLRRNVLEAGAEVML